MDGIRKRTKRSSSTNKVKLTACATTLFAALLSSQPVDAGLNDAGRLSAKVLDRKGKPLAGVKITITNRQKEDYLLNRITDKRGRFHLIAQIPILFDDCFSLYLEADGYQPLQVWEKLAPGRSQRAVYKLFRQSGADLYNQGVNALKSGDRGTAEQLLLNSLKTQPDLVQARHALAQLYLHQRKYLQAIDAVEAVLAEQPQDGQSLEVLYAAHRGLRNSQDARQTLRALAAAGYVVAAAQHFHNEGVRSFRRGDLESAQHELGEAVALNPDLVEAYVQLAKVQNRAGLPVDAEAAAKKALVIEPGHTEAQKQSFKALCMLGQWKKASALLALLIARDPELSDIRLYQWSIERMGLDEALLARKNIEELVNFKPDHARAKLLLGLIAVRTGEVEAARGHLQRYLELAPVDSESQTARTLLYEL